MKRLAYIVSILVICSLMVVYMLSLLVRNGEVQTAAIRWLAAEASQALHADIDVRQVEYRFFNTLHIDDIYLSDQQGGLKSTQRIRPKQTKLQTDYSL